MGLKEKSFKTRAQFTPQIMLTLPVDNNLAAATKENQAPSRYQRW
jgi:hypothetical protein